MTCLPLSTSDIDKESAIGQLMLSENLTFEEAFWRWYDSLGIRTIVINGYAYGLVEAPKSAKTGVRRIYVSDEQRLIKAKLLWRIGKTDRHNTARLLPTDEFNMYASRTYLCNLKGCFDRYNCAWYDMEEEAGGPWNEIPEDWVIGDEKCESFLQKDVQ